MAGSFEDGDWEILLQRLRAKACTPFVGAGASNHLLGTEIASAWASKYGYPLPDKTDLTRVSQFLSVTKDAMFPKYQLLAEFNGAALPNFDDPTEPHGFLADLSFDMYITTNYDDFLVRALEHRGRSPNRVVCRWHNEIEESDTSAKPSVDTPWVFHLHGSDADPQSLVLTEDDYVDFLVRSQQADDPILPHFVKRALSHTSLLFMGYSLNDWTFRVLFRGVVRSLPNSLQQMSIAVQLPKDDTAAVAYLQRYFGDMNVKVFWGTTNDFITELRRRWADQPDLSASTTAAANA